MDSVSGFLLDYGIEVDKPAGYFTVVVDCLPRRIVCVDQYWISTRWH